MRGVFAESVLGFLFCLILLPLLLVVTTPFILLGALWGLGRYREKVKNSYGKVIALWAMLAQNAS